MKHKAGEPALEGMGPVIQLQESGWCGPGPRGSAQRPGQPHEQMEPWLTAALKRTLQAMPGAGHAHLRSETGSLSSTKHKEDCFQMDKHLPVRGKTEYPREPRKGW